MSKGAFGSVTAPQRWLYLVFQVLALLVATVFLVFGIVQAVVALTSDPLALTFPVTVPVPDDDLVGSLGLRLTSASLSQADVMVTGVGPVNRILLALSDLLAAVSIAVIAATVALLCRRLAKGAPFTPACTYAILTSGVALIVGGGSSQLFRGVVRWNVPEHWDGDPIFTNTGGFDTTVTGVAVGLTPVIVGSVLLVIGVIFRHGERLERDIEGPA